MANKKEKKIPELYFVFDERGEYHAGITGKAIMVKKGDQHDDIMQFAASLGSPQKSKASTILGDTDVEAAKAAFEDAGYMVVQADKTDFQEIQRELDKLLTLVGGESKDYPRGK